MFTFPGMEPFDALPAMENEAPPSFHEENQMDVPPPPGEPSFVWYDRNYCRWLTFWVVFLRIMQVAYDEVFDNRAVGV